MTSISIKTQGLTRSFGSVVAVNDLSIEVPGGIIFGFLGPNGSGKTTTIRLLLGLLEPDQGEAEILGYNVHSQAGQIRERCGALLEHDGLYERLSVEDNLEFYGRIWRIPQDERKQRIQELLSNMGLWERRDELAGTWSRGMKQKVAIARALLHRPSLLFLDEPTAGLDPLAALAVREDLARLADQEGITVFLTTHNLPEAEKLCTQVAVIRAGRLLACGPLDELRAQAGGPRLEVIGSGFSQAVLASLRANPDIQDVRLENSHLTIYLKRAVESAPLVSLLVSSGARVEEVRKGKANLEDAFVALVEEE